jgi:hypothetical protein
MSLQLIALIISFGFKQQGGIGKFYYSKELKTKDMTFLPFECAPDETAFVDVMEDGRVQWYVPKIDAYEIHPSESTMAHNILAIACKAKILN